MLGLAQAAVLHRRLKGFRSRAWVVATSLGAACRLVPRHTASRDPRPLGIVASGLGRGIRCCSGGGVVVHHRRGASTRDAAGQVVRSRVGGMDCVGLVRWTRGLHCRGTTLWHEGQSFWFGVLVGLGAAMVMALVMASVTGLGAVRLVAAPTRSAN